VPVLAVVVGIGLRLLSMRSEDGRRPVDTYAAGWDLMIAGYVLTCETLFRLLSCAHESNALCTNYLQIARAAGVTSNEYIAVTVAFLLGSVIVAILVTGLVRNFGWRRESSTHWRLNPFGVVVPWIGGLILLFGVLYLRGR
jgi:hypothetical protein